MSAVLYRGVVWESVQVAAAARGHGIGRLLVDAGCRAAHDAGRWRDVVLLQWRSTSYRAIESD